MATRVPKKSGAVKVAVGGCIYCGDTEWPSVHFPHGRICLSVECLEPVQNDLHHWRRALEIADTEIEEED